MADNTAAIAEAASEAVSEVVENAQIAAASDAASNAVDSALEAAREAEAASEAASQAIIAATVAASLAEANAAEAVNAMAIRIGNFEQGLRECLERVSGLEAMTAQLTALTASPSLTLPDTPQETMITEVEPEASEVTAEKPAPDVAENPAAKMPRKKVRLL